MTGVLKVKELKSRLLGLICGGLAGFFYALGNGLVQFIYRHNSKVELSEFQVVYVRSLIQLGLAVLLLLWKRIKPWGDTWSGFGLLWLMGFVKICSIIFFYASLKGLPLGDATVIMFTSPVFTIILGIVLLREPCSIWNLVFGMFSFLGVAIIAAPGIFFPSSRDRSQTHHHYHSHSLVSNTNQTGTTLNDQASHEQIKSVGFGIISAIALSLHMIILKVNTKAVDYRIAIMYPSILGIIASPICMLAEKEKVVFGELSSGYWVLMVVTGISYFIGMMLLAYALSLEDAGLVALVRNSEVIFAFIFEVLIEKQIPMMFSIVGVVLIVLSTTMIVFNRIVNIEEKICKKLPYCPSCKRTEDDLSEYELISNDCDEQ